MTALNDWRVIAAAPNYEIDRDGLVRRRFASFRDPAGKLIKRANGPAGYPIVTLVTAAGKKSFRLHRLVAIAFLGDPPTAEHHAAHLDGDRTNASASNLAWKLPVDNMADKIRHGTCSRGGSPKLSPKDVAEIRSSVGTHASIAAAFNVTPDTIYRARSGRYWRGI